MAGADDIVDLGDVDLNKTDVFGLLALARFIGIVPMDADKKSLTQEALKKRLDQVTEELPVPHASSGTTLSLCL